MPRARCSRGRCATSRSWTPSNAATPKLPRVPVADNITGEDAPKFRDLWQHIGKRMPKKGVRHAGKLDPLALPTELYTALEALHGHYARVFDSWQAQGSVRRTTSKPTLRGSSKLLWNARRDLALPPISWVARPAVQSAPDAMKPSEALRSHRAAIRSVVQAHRACNARVFGSVLHGRDTEDSDLDILVDPTPDTTLFDISAIRVELRDLLGVPVDVLTPNALPDKFRAAVLAEALPL